MCVQEQRSLGSDEADAQQVLKQHFHEKAKKEPRSKQPSSDSL